MELNKIKDDGAASLKNYYQGWLKETLSNAEKYEAHQALGLLAWRDGDEEAMAKHLSQVASVVVETYQQPTEEKREVYKFAIPFCITFVFADASTFEDLSKIPRKHWFKPEEKEFEPLANIISLIQKWGQTEDNRSAFDDLLGNYNRYITNAIYEPWISRIIRVLEAIVFKNARKFETTIHELTEHHADEAYEGEYQLLVEGLMSLWSSVLYKLALQEGMDFNYKSDYIPETYLRNSKNRI